MSWYCALFLPDFSLWSAISSQMLFELEGYEDDLDYRSIPLSPKTPCSEALGIIVKKFKLPGKVSEYYLVEVSEENEGKAMDLFPWKRKKKALYLSVKVFSKEVLIGDTIFTSPTGDGTAISRCRPRYAKVEPFARQRKYLHFSVILRLWVLVRLGNRTRDLPGSAVKRSTNWTNPSAVKDKKRKKDKHKESKRCYGRNFSP